MSRYNRGRHKEAESLNLDITIINYYVITQAMANYSKKNKVSDKVKNDAMKIARGTQRPGQTKEQTKLIAQGIQKGIAQYKKQQNEKARELDKKHKKAGARKHSYKSPTDNKPEPVSDKTHILPWVLLILSWIGFVAYVVLLK